MRSFCSILLAAALSFHSVDATPLKVVYADEYPSEHAHKLLSRDLASYWPGLNWQIAQQECGWNKMSYLQTAFYGAISLGKAAYNSHISWDGPFEQMFNSGWGRTEETQYYGENIWQNMNASISYPKVGDAKGRFRQAWQLSIRCQETVGTPHCGIPGRRVLAYVIQGSGEMGPQVSFCPDFFNTSIPGAPKDLNTLYHATPSTNLAGLITTGQIVLHEFMHVERFGHCEKIIDLNSTLQSLNGAVGSVYGLSRCEEFAHILGSGIPNPKVTANADNYAWWASGMYWAKAYGIAPSKFRIRAVERRQDNTTVDTTGDMSGDDSADPNGGIVYDDDPDDPSYQVDAADFTAPAAIDIPQCSVDVTNPAQPSMNCDSQTDDPLDPDDPAVDQILTLTATAAASSTILPAAPSTTTAPPAYATGTCSFHVDEYQDCESDATNLYATITMYDNAKNVIGTTTVPDGAIGVSISTPYSLISKLANPMVVIGEHENDYMQFTIGSLSFTSRTTTGPATCSNGGWDPKDGPVCRSRAGDQNAENQVDCSFPC